MTQKEILTWAMSGVKAAWQKLNDQEKVCTFPNVKKVIERQKMATMRDLLELGKMLDELETEAD